MHVRVCVCVCVARVDLGIRTRDAWRLWQRCQAGRRSDAERTNLEAVEAYGWADNGVVEVRLK